MNQEINSLISSRVTFFRKTRGMSMSELAAKLKHPLSHQQIQKYESGQSRWPADMVCEVAELLEINVGQLLCQDEVVDLEQKSVEYEAEKYKQLIKQLPAELRSLVYNLTDEIVRSKDKLQGAVA